MSEVARGPRPGAALFALVAGPAAFAASAAAGSLGAGCPSRTLLGVDCPLCGGTRATMALLEGRWRDAVDQNVMAVTVVLPALVALSVLAAWRLATGAPPPRASRRANAVAWAAFVVVAVFGVVRNLPLEPLGWLHSGLQL